MPALNVTTASAVAFALVTAGIIVFQLALALGAPWGSYAMGGKFPGRYPPAMRVAALAQTALLAFLAVIVLSDAKLVLPALSEGLPSLIWLSVVFSAVSVVLNAITPSLGERKVWLPVAVVMLASSLAMALSAS